MPAPGDLPPLFAPAVADVLGAQALPLEAADLVALHACSRATRDLLDGLPRDAWQAAARASPCRLIGPLPPTVSGWVAASAARARITARIRSGAEVARVSACRGSRLIDPRTVEWLACRRPGGWREMNLLTGRFVVGPARQAGLLARARHLASPDGRYSVARSADDHLWLQGDGRRIDLGCDRIGPLNGRLRPDALVWDADSRYLIIPAMRDRSGRRAQWRICALATGTSVFMARRSYAVPTAVDSTSFALTLTLGLQTSFYPLSAEYAFGRVAADAITIFYEGPLPTYAWAADGASWLQIDGPTLVARGAPEGAILASCTLPAAHRVQQIPRLSPDRRRWAVVSHDDVSCHLRLWDGVRVVLAMQAVQYSVLRVREWSADSQWLLVDAWPRQHWERSPHLWLLDAESGAGGAFALDGVTVRGTALSPSGEFVAICSESAVPTTGPEPRLPSWIAAVYACRDRTCLMRETRRGPARPGADVVCPAWSPDESRLFVGHAVIYFALPDGWQGGARRAAPR